MATKKSTAGKATMIITVATTILQSPAVQEALKKAPAAVMQWARETARQRKERGMPRLKVLDRFGQAGLERRLASLREVVDKAWGSPAAPGRVEVEKALQSVDAALHVAGRLPVVKRAQAHRKISTQLDKLENSFMNAVLTPLGDAT